MTAEGGAVGVLVAAIAALALVLAVLISDTARVVAARAQLATAADAAALAAAPPTFAEFGTDESPSRAARVVAAANGAELVACDCPIDRTWAPRTVEVTVAMDVSLWGFGTRRITATAAAEFRPIALGQR